MKESYQCIPAVCIVSPVKDGPGQAAIGLRSMFTSHLSYRAGSLPSAQTESPSPLPSVFPRFSSAVEQQTSYNIDKVRAETTKTQDADDVTFNSTAGGEPTEECVL